MDQQCLRCAPNVVSLLVDEQDGFLLCPQCGFVAEEHGLVDQRVFDGETGSGKVLVAEDADGAGMQGRAGDAWSHAVGHSTQAYSTRYLRALTDKLEAISSRLPIPSRMVEEATNTLKQAYNSKAIHLSKTGYAEALCAAVLQLVLRTNKQPASLVEIATAAGVNRHLAAHMYRQLIALPCLGNLTGNLTDSLVLPSCSIRALCFRHASHFVRSAERLVNHPTSGRLQPAVGAAGSGTAHEDVRKHPFVKAAMDVAELVARTGAAEGRSPPVVAGGILLMLGGAPDMYKVYGFTAEILASQIGCAVSAIHKARNFISQQLLQLAQLLPMGTLINVSNLPTYLPLLVSAIHTIVALKRQSQPAQQIEQPQPAQLLSQQEQQPMPLLLLFEQEQEPMPLLPKQKQQSSLQEEQQQPLLQQEQQGQAQLQAGTKASTQQGHEQQLQGEEQCPAGQPVRHALYLQVQQKQALVPADCDGVHAVCDEGGDDNRTQQRRPQVHVQNQTRKRTAASQIGNSSKQRLKA